MPDAIRTIQINAQIVFTKNGKLDIKVDVKTYNDGVLDEGRWCLPAVECERAVVHRLVPWCYGDRKKTGTAC